MKLIDTNVFLELLLGKKGAASSSAFLARVSSGEEDAVVTHFSLHSVEALLDRAKVGIAPFLRNVEQSAGLLVYDTSLSDESAASILKDEVGLGFDDALQYFVARKLGAEEIVSFDRHFDGLDIPRAEPR
ncbi:MAG: type II toxin-antitoxin system VapC family toxin [Thaumarchaeota archaeon]|nr:type II toxin-antitoxin system VapC family toxin [Nitrososphaerota archaeon]